MCALESGPVCDFSCPCGSAVSTPHCISQLQITPCLVLVSSPPGLQEEAGRTYGVLKRWAPQPSHPNHLLIFLQFRSAVREGWEDTSLLLCQVFTSLPSSHFYLLSLYLWILPSASQFFYQVHNTASTDTTWYYRLLTTILDLTGWGDGRNTETWLLQAMVRSCSQYLIKTLHFHVEMLLCIMDHFYQVLLRLKCPFHLITSSLFNFVMFSWKSSLFWPTHLPLPPFLALLAL